MANILVPDGLPGTGYQPALGRLAANIMSLPPAAWTVVNATPNRPNCHAFQRYWECRSFKSKKMSDR